MTQSNIVQPPWQLRAPNYECSRECISPEAFTAHCGASACCELTGAKTAVSSQLYVKCPLFCGERIDVAKIKLASEGRNRTIWNCSHCAKIKKKQVKIAWRHFVCVQCTHTHGTTCLIEHCTSNCPTKKALERLDDRTFKKAKNMIDGLKEAELLERLTVLRTAWILGSGHELQPWCRLKQRLCRSRKQLMSMLHSGYQAIAAKRSVRLPAGFCDDMADKFDFHNCMTRLQMNSTGKWPLTSRIGTVFNYKDEFYQDVRHFCKQYTGLNQSAAAADVENTNFPKTACLVVPGYSCFRTLKAQTSAPDLSTRQGDAYTDLSTRKGDAYILAKGEKPTRPYLLLVSLTELKRAATAAIISAERRRHSGFVTRVLEAKEAERRRRKQRSKSVIKDSRKGDRHRSRRNQARIEPSVQ